MGTVDLGDLPVFVAVAETASFSEAARRLGIPKSSVSRAIASLESAMGVRLLHRTTRRVSLSSAGAALYERLAGPLRAVEESVQNLPEMEEEPSGRLRVTAPLDLGARVLAEIVARFTQRHPAVEVELSLTNEFVDIVAEGFDVALRISTRALKDSSLVARAVAPIQLQLFASPAYLARRKAPRTPADLAGHEWIVFRPMKRLRLESGTSQATVECTGRVSCDDMLYVRESVRHGVGIGVLPIFLGHTEVSAGNMVRVLPRWTARSGQLFVLSPEARHQPRKVTAFREHLVESLRARPL